MGTQKNSRKKIPTSKKLAAENDTSPPHRTSSRPKPKPIGKAAAAIKSSRTEASRAGQESEIIVPASKKTRRSVTFVDSDNDVSMVAYGTTEDDEDYSSRTWDELVGDKDVEEEVEEDDEDIEEEGDEEDEEFEDLKRHISTAQAKRDVFQIPFEVSVNGRFKDLPIPCNATWEAAQILIGKKMLRTPESLSLGYINPFKSRTGKSAPNSLENREEWRGLLQHVKTYLTNERAKKRGKGGVSKPWTIILVDLSKDTAQPSRVSSKTGRGSKAKEGQKNNEYKNEEDNDDESGPGSDSRIIADICRRHHCDRCGKACYIDPGPPPIHKPFTMEQISVWMSLVKLKAATIDQAPDVLRLSKRRDRDPLPPPTSDSSKTIPIPTTNSTDSQVYNTNPGFATQAFPPFSAPFHMPSYPMPSYPSMYMPPYGYPFAPPFMLPNYQAVSNYQAQPMPNYPAGPAPMYAQPPPSNYPPSSYPPSSYPQAPLSSYPQAPPFGMQPPQGPNLDHGCQRYTVDSDNPLAEGTVTNQDTQDTPES